LLKKLRCVLNIFKSVTEDMSNGKITSKQLKTTFMHHAGDAFNY